MMRFTIMRPTVQLLLACAASYLIAQPVAAKDQPGSQTEAKDSAPDKDTGNAAWSGEVSASALRGGVSGPDEEYGGAGYSLGGEVAFQQKFGDSRIRIEYESVYREYDDAGRDDQWRNRISGQARIEIDDSVYLFGEGQYSTNLSGPEARSFDQTQALAALEFRPGDHRLKLQAGWRWRDYDDGLTTKGDGLLAELEYRYLLGRRNFVGAEVRYEEIGSDLAHYSYDRTTVRAYYAHPLGAHASLRVGSSLAWLQFTDRPVASAGSENRNDFTVTPEVDLLYEFDIGLFLRAKSKYLVRKSTEPDYDPNSHRITVTAGYRF